MKKSEHSKSGLYFLFLIIITYTIIFCTNKSIFNQSTAFFLKILSQIYWVFILIFFLMILTNYFFTPQTTLKYLGKSSTKKSWILVIIFGILSVGPIYMWYPLLAELKEKGMREGLIACFLYNRAIKIPLLPLMVFYFSLKFTAILLLIMIFFSVVQGILIEKINSGGKNENSNSMSKKRS